MHYMTFTMVFILSAGSDVLPHPGEVMFGVDKQYGHSMLSWQFREPRMVTSLDVNPLPFTVTPQLNEWQTIEDLKVRKTTTSGHV